MVDDNKNFEFNVVFLRFIAITSVVIYHLFPSWLPYGYIGVDIFFVISGYLILTKNLHRLDVNNFQVINFYTSRLKRIIPATYSLLLIATIFAWFLLINYDFLNFAHSLKNSIVFRANYYFSQNGGYFGINDALKPLLHLWSLSIEAQFYFYFPFILLILNKLKLKLQIILILIIIIISLLYNIYNDNILNRSSFFSFTARIWEFGIGMLIALLPKFNKSGYSKSIIFLQFICIAFILFNFYFPLIFLPPSFLAVFFSCLLIWSSRDLIFINIIKIKKFIIFIAEISFSLYLLHWPIIVFINYYYPDGVPLLIQIFYIPLIIIFSRFYFLYFENIKFKKNNLLFFTSFVIVFIFLNLIAHIIIKKDGFPSRFSTDVNLISSAVNSNYKCPDNGSFVLGASKRACFIGDLSQPIVSVALLGNSHAQMYADQVSSLLMSQGKKGILIPLDGCLPFVEFNLTNDCLLWARANLDYVLNVRSIQTVLVGSTWYSDILVDEYGQTFNDVSFQLRKASIVTLASKFKEHGKSFYLIGPIQIPLIDYASTMSRRLAFHESESTLSVPRLHFDSKYADLINFSGTLLGPNFLPAHDYLCDDADCFFSSEKEVYFADSNHLSIAGAARMLPLFSNVKF